MGFYINEYINSNLSEVVISDVYEQGYTWVVGKACDSSFESNSGYFAKIGSNGIPIWQKTYIFSDLESNDTEFGFYKIIKLSQDSFVIQAKDTNGLWLVWMDAAGVPVKRKKYYDKADYIDTNDVFESDFLIQLANDELVLLIKEYIYNESLYLSAIIHKLIKIDGISGDVLKASHLNNGTGTKLNINDYTVHNNNMIFSSYVGYGGASVLFSIDNELNLINSLEFGMQNPTLGFKIFSVAVRGNNYLIVLGGYSSHIYGESGKYLIIEINTNNQTVTNISALNLDFSTTDTQNEIKHIFCENNGIYLRDMNSISFFTENLVPVWTKSLSGFNGYGIFKPSVGKVFVTTSGNNKLGRIKSDLSSCITIPGNTVGLLPNLSLQAYLYTITISAYTNLEYVEELNVRDSVHTDNNVVVICPLEDEIIELDQTSLQSPHFYLQAAGSKGQDSTAGIHLRWLLKNRLEFHLPKGNYFQGSPQGWNRPDDFVKIYRAPYTPAEVTLDLHTVPSSTQDSQALWLYNINGKTFHVYFRNNTRYAQVRLSVNPMNNPASFLSSYGANLIEVENKENLFFGFRFVLTQSPMGAYIRTEACAVEANTITAVKNTVFRKKLTDSEMTAKIFTENTRSIRYAASGTVVKEIRFEFYHDFIHQANLQGGWKPLGEYSLSLDDSEALQRLEPKPAVRPVHAVWPRYNDGEFVNRYNYIKKWNGDLPDVRNTIKDTVNQYLVLSNDPLNPLATETYYLNDIEPDPNVPEDPEDPENSIEVSNLMLLQMASLDYHVARMLGLGHLDLDDEVYGTGKFVYAALYTSEGDLEDKLGARTVKHLSLSLPTSTADSRSTLPVQLKAPVPGIYSSIQTDMPVLITDVNGYTHDGKYRYISLFAEEPSPDEPAGIPFYYTHDEFNLSDITFPVYAGIEYKKQSDTSWRIPELPNDSGYRNVDDTGGISGNETIAIGIPEPNQPVFIHRETKSGIHVYGSYGVNWFGRSTSSPVTWAIETEIVPANLLLPPSAGNALLIQEERPLFLTSRDEQDMLEDLLDDNNIEDKTFIRLTFNYDASRDMISYHQAINGVEISGFSPLPDEDEIFADEAEIFFRPQTPKQVFGEIDEVTDDPGNPLVVIVKAVPLFIASTGETLPLDIPQNEVPNYIGGIFSVGADNYIIHQITLPDTPLDKPTFHLLKRSTAEGFGNQGNNPGNTGELEIPEAGQAFIIIENMLNEASWGMVNPHPLKVQLGVNWDIHHEQVVIQSGSGNDTQLDTYLRKFRGFLETASVTKEFNSENEFEGLYKITFNQFQLPEHPQFENIAGKNNVRWYRGSIRVTYESNPNGERKVLQVLRAENIGENENLILYALDGSHEDDPLQAADRTGIAVNYYPGYKVCLYRNLPCRLTENHILPQDENMNEKYSIFGIRSRVSGNNIYISDISTPVLMFARKITEPMVPDQPIGALYATRPDYFGRSTYTFTTKYQHKPYSVTFLRSNDEALLSSLYKLTPYEDKDDILIDSVQDIRVKNSDEYYNNRLLDLADAKIEPDGLFREYNGYRFPIPNNPLLFGRINEFITRHNQHYGTTVPHITPESIVTMNQVVVPALPGEQDNGITFHDFVKQAIVNTYVPLTEIPIIYQHIKGGTYKPIPKAQVIRDKNGQLLKTNDPEFDMAPMMKVIGTNPHQTQFTDFTLDGASTAVYFYAVRETNLQMRTSPLSEALGPVKLVNSYSIGTPEIKSVIPVLEVPVLGISPALQFELNAYPAYQSVKKLNLYRTLNGADSASVRTMTLVKSFDLEAEEILENNIWTIQDDFTDLPEVPFGDPLFYRITALAQVEYAKADYSETGDNSNMEIVIEYAPSQPSKILLTTIVENILPSSPLIDYYSEPLVNGELHEVILHWEKQVYNAKYYLYKMNNQGNWVQIHTLQTNEEQIYLPLNATDLDSSTLVVRDSSDNPVYHHFKVITENTAGMLSTEERILTIYLESGWQDIGGISSNGEDGMIVGITFVVR